MFSLKKTNIIRNIYVNIELSDIYDVVYLNTNQKTKLIPNLKLKKEYMHLKYEKNTQFLIYPNSEKSQITINVNWNPTRIQKEIWTWFRIS